jgi:hypothetical protein
MNDSNIPRIGGKDLPRIGEKQVTFAYIVTGTVPVGADIPEFVTWLAHQVSCSEALAGHRQGVPGFCGIYANEDPRALAMELTGQQPTSSPVVQ